MSFKDVERYVAWSDYTWLLAIARELINSDAKGELRLESGGVDPDKLATAMGHEQVHFPALSNDETCMVVLDAATYYAGCVAETEAAESADPPSATAVLDRIAANRGVDWDTRDFIRVLAGFIEEQDLLDEFERYVQAVVEDDVEEFQAEPRGAAAEGAN